MAQQTDHIGDTNKMVTMKLFSEEQVKEMIEKSRETGLTAEYLILTTTPIELPSDEEIWQEADKENFITQHYAFMRGTEWMKEQILNQKK